MNFTTQNIVWSQNTLILYISIIAGCYLTALVFGRCYFKFGNYFRFPVWLLIISSVLIFFKGFGTTGRDLRAGYYYDFLSATSFEHFRDKTIEFGYRVLNVLVRNITDQYWVFILVVSILTIVPFMYIVYKYKDQIDVPITVLFYTSIFYFSGFSPLRVAMAASIALLALDGVIEKKKWKSLFFILLACLFHASVAILLIPYVLIFARIIDKRMILIGTFLLFLIIYFKREDIINLLLSSSRYYGYGTDEVLRIGMEQFCYYIPIFVLIFLTREKCDSGFQKLSIAFVSIAFVSGLCSYIIPVFARMNMDFILQAFIVGWHTKILKEEYSKLRLIINLILILYCSIRFWLYISQYYNLEDIMPYTNIFGAII